MTTKRTTQIPEKKLKEVKELTRLARESSTILIASIKNLPHNWKTAS